MKLFTTIRNNWKKSLFGACLLTYGTKYLYDRKETNKLHQAYCIEVAKYNKVKAKPTEKLPRVTVFLNPISNNDKSKALYDKYAAPLLHLSGLDVRLVRLDAKNEITDLMKLIDDSQTDCIIIAGGNRTIIECLTSLFKRNDDLLQRIKIGVIPLGENNSLVEKLFQITAKKEQVKLIGDSVMSIIENKTQKLSAFRVSMKDADNESNEIYAFSNVSFGFETDAKVLEETYWLYGPFKNYINNYYKLRNQRFKSNSFEATYKNYCSGCRKCFNKIEKLSVFEIEPKNFAQFFFKKFIADNRNKLNYEKTRAKYPINNDCDIEHELIITKPSQIDLDINNQQRIDGMNMTGQQLHDYDDDFDVFHLNLAEFNLRKFNFNTNTIIIDNEFYNLDKFNQISISYVNRYIDFLFDSNLNHLLFKHMDNMDPLNTFFKLNSNIDFIQPFKRLYDAYSKL